MLRAPAVFLALVMLAPVAAAAHDGHDDRTLGAHAQDGLRGGLHAPGEPLGGGFDRLGEPPAPPSSRGGGFEGERNDGGLGSMRGDGLGSYGAGSVGNRGLGGLGAMTDGGLGSQRGVR